MILNHLKTKLMKTLLRIRGNGMNEYIFVNKRTNKVSKAHFNMIMIYYWRVQTQNALWVFSSEQNFSGFTFWFLLHVLHWNGLVVKSMVLPVSSHHTSNYLDFQNGEHLSHLNSSHSCKQSVHTQKRTAFAANSNRISWPIWHLASHLVINIDF